MNPENIELVTDKFYKLGEGPVWDEQRQEILWLDITEGEIHRYSLQSNLHTIVKVDQMIGAIALTEAGELIAALQHGFARVNLENASVDMLFDPEKHLPDNRFNDGKCDPAGRFWAGSMSLHNEPQQGSLYVLDTNLSVLPRLNGVSCSNGLAWSADMKTMYFIDTAIGKVAAFDYDLSNAQISNKRMVVNVDPAAGLPDGMTIDTEGMLWIAIWGGNCVNRYNPHTGQLLYTLHLPVSQVTSCTFGGPTLQDLYITSARLGLSERQLTKEPLAGGLFVVKSSGFTGMPAFRFGS